MTEWVVVWRRVHTVLHQITHSLGGLVPNAAMPDRTGLDQTRPIKATSRLFLRPMSLSVSVSVFVSVSLCRLFIQAFEWRTSQRSQPKKFKVSPRRVADQGVWLRFDFGVDFC